MPRAVSVVAVCLLSAAAAGCAAGTPQDEIETAEAELALLGVTTVSEEARLQIADGVREYDAQRSDVALEHFERAIAADPASPTAHLWAAQTALSTADAYAYTAKAMELSQSASEPERLMIAMIDQFNRSDSETARATGVQLTRLVPDNPRAWMLLARADSLLVRTEESRVSMHRAVEVAPAFTPAWIALSQSYAASSPLDFAKAEQYARKAMELSPDESVVHNILGDALRAQGKLEEAAQSYTREAELNATDGSGLQQRGHVNTFFGRYSEARADYAAAVNLSDGIVRTSFEFYQAYVSLHEGKPAQAMQEFEAVYNSIEIGKTEAALDMQTFAAAQEITIAFHNRMMPELKRATQRFIEHNRAISTEVGTPDYARSAQAFEALLPGYAALLEGDNDAARIAAADYMRIREADRAGNKDFPAHELLGYIALEEKKYEEALREFGKADIDNMMTEYYKGLALEGLGRTDEAQKIFERVTTWYFNSLELAVVRHDALAKVRKVAS